IAATDTPFESPPRDCGGHIRKGAPARPRRPFAFFRTVVDYDTALQSRGKNTAAYVPFRKVVAGTNPKTGNVGPRKARGSRVGLSWLPCRGTLRVPGRH